MRKPRAAMALAAVAAGLHIGAANAAAQQVAVGDPFEGYLRVLQVAGAAQPIPISIRPFAVDRARDALRGQQHPWRERLSVGPRGLLGSVQILDPELRSFWNSSRPDGQNDGAVWQGKGATLELSAGAVATLGPVTAAIRPSVVYAENRPFSLAPDQPIPARSQFANPWYPRRGIGGQSIDLPQRFGPDGFWTIDLGQSYVRADLGPVAFGVSNENMWWGPALRNAIVMSNNAPGFIHGFLGTSGPTSIGIGTAEARWIWGRLSESDYFDADPTNDDRFVTGIVVGFQPSVLPGLHLGASRLFYEIDPPGGLDFSEYFLIFQGITKSSQQTPGTPGGNDERDQLLSLFARWVLPESGFEAYVEWTRNDHSGTVRDLLVQPEHSQAYTYGFQKTFQAGARNIVRVLGELTHLELSKTILDRPTPSYYAHIRVDQGYTHRGQVIGAGIGPGSNSQYLGVDLFSRWGRIGGFVLREVRDNDTYYRLRADNLVNFSNNDVVWNVGATGRFFLTRFDLSGTLAYGVELNRYFIARNDVGNLRLEAALRWRI